MLGGWNEVWVTWHADHPGNFEIVSVLAEDIRIPEHILILVLVFEFQMRGAGRSRVVKRKSPPCSCSSLLRKRFEKITRDAAPRCFRSVTLLRRRPKVSSVGGRDGRFACVAKHCDLSSRPPLPVTCFGA